MFYFFFFLKFFFILKYNLLIVLVLGVQNSGSVFLHIIFHYRLLQNNRYNSLCVTVYACCLYILYIVVSVC